MTAATRSTLSLRARGPVNQLTASTRALLFDRSTSFDPAIRNRTAGIIADVRARGDAALTDMARELDGVALRGLEIPMAECVACLEALGPGVRAALERARDNIAHVHEADLPSVRETSPEPGVVVGRRPDPLDRVGVYAPGGRASYPSSVLMGAVPARVAGVREVVVCSPPTSSGRPSPMVLAAAALAGVDRVFAVGGAGAIAAMAYGTATIPRVDRIVGPGNAWVAEAKLQVAGAVAIDSPAGPSEILVIAGASASPDAVALELLAQAEHDPRATAVACAIGEDAAAAIEVALEAALERQPRRTICAQALATGGAVLWVDTATEAIAFSNAYAPEHLLIAGEAPEQMLPLLRNAGTIVIGPRSSVAFGDYMTGANHVLPTGGLARCYSGLSVLDFIRWTTYQRVTMEAAASLALDVALLAECEGLPGHAMAARAAGGTV